MKEKLAAALDQAASALMRVPGGGLVANTVLAPLRPTSVPCTDRQCTHPDHDAEGGRR